MPIPQDVLAILVCPVTKQPLEVLPPEKLATLNRLIAQGRVRNTAGSQVESPVAEALITTDGKTVYRIDGDVPNMLAEEGIPTEQIAGF